MFKKIRVLLLLIILATVAQQTFLDQADLNWKDNFYVAVYPINADGSDEVAAYINTLTRDDFEPMAAYFAEEAARYNLGLRRPVEVQLGDRVSDIPPAPPNRAAGRALGCAPDPAFNPQFCSIGSGAGVLHPLQGHAGRS